MNTEDVRTLYAYNRWANHRTIETVRPIKHNEFTYESDTSHGSIRGTIVHILWAEWIWLQRWQGESPKRIFAPEDFPDIGTIESYWQGVQSEQQEFIAQVTDGRLKDRLTYKNLQGESLTYQLGHMMQHVVNHSSCHRGQVVTLLRQLKRTPKATDFLDFLDESNEFGIP